MNKHKIHRVDRRRFMKNTSLLLCSATVFPMTLGNLIAGELEKVDETSSLATSIKYAHDASSIAERNDSSAYCKNCQLYSGTSDAEWGACSIFSGKAVNANGWCSAWIKKVS